MKLEGDFLFEAPVADVWSALFDPEMLAAVLPGCDKLELQGDHFVGALTVKVGPVQGKFAGKVQLRDIDEPKSYTMGIDGSGSTGFVKATASVKLVPEGKQTRIQYSADAQVGGKIASVGQRLVEATARAVAKQALEGMHENIKIRLAAKEGAAEEETGASEAEAGAESVASEAANKAVAEKAPSEEKAPSDGEAERSEPQIANAPDPNPDPGPDPAPEQKGGDARADVAVSGAGGKEATDAAGEAAAVAEGESGEKQGGTAAAEKHEKATADIKSEEGVAAAKDGASSSEGPEKAGSPEEPEKSENEGAGEKEAQERRGEKAEGGERAAIEKKPVAQKKPAAQPVLKKVSQADFAASVAKEVTKELIPPPVRVFLVLLAIAIVVGIVVLLMK